jgi:hypothetical protein
MANLDYGPDAILMKGLTGETDNWRLKAYESRDGYAAVARVFQRV